jgi:pimeloyl-ACP methyl ester carboxylesterase
MTEHLRRTPWPLVALTALMSLAPLSGVFAIAARQPQRLPFSEHFIDVGGIRTRYIEAGKGETVVLIHGGDYGDGVNADRWDRNIPGLSVQFHILALDRLGQGFTANPTRDDDYTMEASVRHTYAAIQKLGLTRIHLVGASRGAYAATMIALEHPELVRSLVLCDSATIAPETGDPARRDRLVLTDQPTDLRGAEIHRLKQLSYSHEHITDATVDLAVRIMSQPKNVEARTKLAAAKARIAPAFEEEKKATLARLKTGELKTPTLLAWGYNDGSAIIPNALALFAIVAEHNPQARMYIMNQAGHYNYREHPEEFNRVVTDFIRTFGVR